MLAGLVKHCIVAEQFATVYNALDRTPVTTGAQSHVHSRGEIDNKQQTCHGKVSPGVAAFAFIMTSAASDTNTRLLLLAALKDCVSAVSCCQDKAPEHTAACALTNSNLNIISTSL